MSQNFAFTVSITVPDLVTGIQKQFFAQTFSEEQCVQYFQKPIGKDSHKEIIIDLSKAPIVGRFFRILIKPHASKLVDSLQSVEIYPMLYQSK